MWPPVTLPDWGFVLPSLGWGWNHLLVHWSVLRKGIGAYRTLTMFGVYVDGGVGGAWTLVLLASYDCGQVVMV